MTTKIGPAPAPSPALSQAQSQVWTANLFALLTIPFLANDLTNIYVHDFAAWLLIDYVVTKALPLAIIFWALTKNKLTRGDLALAQPPTTAMLVETTLTATALGIAINTWGYDFLAANLPALRLGGIPFATSGPLYWFDLFAGLFLVAVAEETVFRSLAWKALAPYIKNPAARILASSLLFGLIHWSLGLPAVVSAAVIGVVFTLVMLRANSIVPTIIAHFAVNFAEFSGLL